MDDPLREVLRIVGGGEGGIVALVGVQELELELALQLELRLVGAHAEPAA